MAPRPHFAVKPPQDRQAEWNQVLADYDEHCHDVIQLDRDSFKTELPVHHFSEVFFNPNHTLALVDQGMWCGGLCGNATWVALERKGSQWVQLPWVRVFTIS